MSNVLYDLLSNVPIPPVIKIRQHFPAQRITDVPQAVREQLQRPEVLSTLKPGQRIAVTVGSRGIAKLPEIVGTVVQFLKDQGTSPFIIPCMGSHGGATAQGQREVLAGLGITEDTMGVPIRASMETVEIGVTTKGIPVYVDKFAHEADGIVVINRVKPHTAFRGRYESGLMKMLTIGLGKQHGAEICHAAGFKYMHENMPAAAMVILAKEPILFGVATVENAYDEPMLIRALTKEEIPDQEPGLLELARENMPRLPFEHMDVLIVDEIGKNISGDGMDPNVTGRYASPYASGGPEVEKIVVLDITDESHGNGNGLGMADFTTQRAYRKFDFLMTYPNAITSTLANTVRVPMVLDSDRLAIQAAIKTCNRLNHSQVEMVRIKNTLKVSEMLISPPLVEPVKQLPDVEIVSGPQLLEFDAQSNLL
ncbi:MAG: DUF2088 domain-containing protein [Clostridia bacterium]|nr:DUF2088 domain-containing protein [Clostridia bacterium]